MINKKINTLIIFFYFLFACNIEKIDIHQMHKQTVLHTIQHNESSIMKSDNDYFLKQLTM